MRPLVLAPQTKKLPARIQNSRERLASTSADTAATKVTLPFVEEQLHAARSLMGTDFWCYGVTPNAHVLDTFLRHHHAQGLSTRRVAVEELFHTTTLESAKI